MVQVSNNFSGVGDGNTLTTGNSGGSGNTAFDVVSIGTSHAAISSSEQQIRARNSLKVSLGATSGSAQFGWNPTTITGTPNTLYAQAYLYVTANPSANINLIRFSTGGTTTAVGTLVLLTTGFLRLTNSAVATVATSSNQIALNQWVRVQLKGIGNATTGALECNYFNNAALESATPTETFGGTNTNTGGTSVDYARFGIINPQTNQGPVYFADVDVRDTGYAPALGSGGGSQGVWTYQKTITVG